MNNIYQKFFIKRIYRWKYIWRIGDKMAGNFTEIDEEFICEHCGQHVPKLGYSCRNHCPYCLYSKHVDVNPGDRQEDVMES